jgi:hypothetical protein
MAEVITHEAPWGPWLEVRWRGRTEDVFDATQSGSAMAYALALEMHGRPLVDEEEDA